MTIHNDYIPDVPVGSSLPKGPTALPPVPTGSVPPKASKHNPPKKNNQDKKNTLRNMKIYTYNVRTLSEDHKLEELVEDLDNISWDIVGLSEVRRKEEHLIKLKDSHHLFYYRGKENGKSHGVGFLINNDIADNVVKFDSTSDRIAWVVVKLCNRYSLKVIQVYAPTSQSSEEELESFYEDITRVLEEEKTQYTLIIGDFNAKVGRNAAGESSVGKFGVGERNERGEVLVSFAEKYNLRIMNTFFQKRKGRKWTWKSPNGATKNEIDFIIADKNNSVNNVTVINKVNIGSDHRMVGCTAKFNFRATRNKLILKKKICPEKIKENQMEFQLEIRNRFQLLDVTENDDIDKANENLTTAIREAAEKIGSTKTNKESKYSQTTVNLMKKRKTMIIKTRRDEIEKAELNKLINKRRREEERKRNMDLIEETIKKGKSLKQAQRKLALGKQQMTSLKNSNGEITNCREQMVKIVEEFYEQLYSSSTPVPPANSVTDTSEVPEITVDEVRSSLNGMKRGKSPGDDGITTDLLKDAGFEVHSKLAHLFNQCLSKREVPEAWCNAIVVLLHKKGDKTNLGNYRPISLLSVVYKLFSKVLTKRLESILDENQPREQAGFRSGYSTMDHLHTINQLIEKTSEFNKSLCLAFVDYEKAFDSVETMAIINSLQEQGINKTYIKLLENIYVKGTAVVRLHKDTEKIKIGKGVRQGDTISPKLFTACLEGIFRRLSWENKGINIDGENLNHLRFADDIVLISENPDELQAMLSDLNKESLKVGLKMNRSKTKVMYNDNTQRRVIKVEEEIIEEVQEYNYLGQVLKLTKDNENEVKRRIILGWKAFGKQRHIMKSSLPICLKRKVYNQCILPTMIYGSETWKLTKTMTNKLRSAQRAMERSMLGVTLRDKKRATWIREQTKVKDILEAIKEQKWRWAGHVARREDNRWSKRLTDWTPRDGKRSRKRPDTRWRDEIEKTAGVTWQRLAKCRESWKGLKEAFVQQWTPNG